jgi:hypothetical protein
MSATKATRKWAQAATVAELSDRRTALFHARARERNSMRRASLSECDRIIAGELARRDALASSPATV